MATQDLFDWHISQLVAAHDVLRAQLKHKPKNRQNLSFFNNNCYELPCDGRGYIDHEMEPITVINESSVKNETTIDLEDAEGVSKRAANTTHQDSSSQKMSITLGVDEYATMEDTESDSSLTDNSHRCQVVQMWESFVRKLITSETCKPREIWEGQRLKSQRTASETFRVMFLKTGEDEDVMKDLWFQNSTLAMKRHFSSKKSGTIDLGGAIKNSTRELDKENNGSSPWKPFHPFSRPRVTWLVLGVFSLTLDFSFLSLQVFGLSNESVLIQATEWTSAFYWAFDIVMSFASGALVKHKVLLDFRSIAEHYVRTWFIFDLLMVIVQWLTVSVGGIPKSGFLRYLRMARYTRLLRLVKLDHLISELMQRFNSILVVAAMRTSMYLLGVVVYVHVCATLWYWVGKQSPNGWAFQVFDEQNDALPLNYFVSAYWSAAQLQGGSNIYPGWANVWENAFAMWQTLTSVVVLAALVSKLTNTLLHLQDVKSAQNRQLNSARRYLDEHHIDLELSARVRKYVEIIMITDSKCQNKQSEIELFQILPRELRQALYFQARHPVLNDHIIFRAFRASNFRMFEKICCDLASTASHLPDENVFSIDMVSKDIIVTTAGEFSYAKPTWFFSVFGSRNSNQSITRKGISTLKRGQLVCESTLWACWVHRGDMDATTHATAIVLEITSMEKLIKSHPAIKSDLMPHAKNFTAYMVQETELSDLCTSADVLAHEYGPC